MQAVTSPDRIRFLPTSSRSVRLENRAALLRRWRLARAGLLSQPRAVARWFPGQRRLLELLEVLEEVDVERVADCATPLFGLPLGCTELRLDPASEYSCQEPLEQEAAQECFLALSGRLDAIRTSLQQACILFAMAPAEASWLSRHCPHELKVLARDPSMLLNPVASHEFFIAAAHPDSQLSGAERTVLSAVSRRVSVALAT